MASGKIISLSQAAAAFAAAASAEMDVTEEIFRSTWTSQQGLRRLMSAMQQRTSSGCDASPPSQKVQRSRGTSPCNRS